MTILQPADDEDKYFDRSYQEPCKILSCTNLFPVIHPRLHTIPPSHQSTSNVKNTCYMGPIDFWRDLSQVFIENMRINYPGTTKRIYLDTLREMSYHLYKAWSEHLYSIDNLPAQPQISHNQNDVQTVVKTIIDQFEFILNEIQKSEVQLNPDLKDQYQQILTKIQKLFENLKLYDIPYLESQNLQYVIQIQQLTNQFMIHEQTVPSMLGKKQMIDQIINKIKKVLQEKNIDLQENKSVINIEEEKEQVKLYEGETQFAKSQQDYSWILDQHETISQVLKNDYFDYEDIKQLYNNSSKELDPLYLVKWKNMSYLDITWEPLTTIKSYEKLLLDFERFNRSLDNGSRQKMVGFNFAHKQIIKIYQKKLSFGKKIDSRCHEEFQTREMLDKLLKFEMKMTMEEQKFQYNFNSGLVPQFRFGQKMKNYQVAGLNWMIRAFSSNLNVVLADEMGLGKTIQSISFLDHLIKICKIRGPFLIIAPLSTLDHWKKVAEDWTFMNTVIFHDQKGQDGRNEIIKQEWYYTDVTNKGTMTQKSKLIKFNIMITSYEVFNQELKQTLIDIPFQFIIIDEAHRLKNKATKTLTLLKEHPCRKVMLLTGTPIQNNTKELFTLLNYIEPDKFGSFEHFMEEFGDLKTKEQVDELHKKLRPHFLRRLKDEVEDEIPPLKETVIEVGLTSLQQQYYKGIYGENLSMLASMGSSSLKAASFCNLDIQLRKCCNHLYLLKGVQEDIEKKCVSDEDYFKKLIEGSGKMILLDKFIDKYREDGHKILVFSQFKGMTEIIKDYLQIKKIRYEILTGSIKSQDRAISIQRFNEDNEFGVFLLTTRAGGLGINLTKARVVIIYDSDWNPQNDLQAIARAHRIGQKFEVEVFRFITAKTYEQHMFDKASKKLGMEHAVFQKGAFGIEGEDDAGISEDQKMSKEDIERLLKQGAFAFFDNEDEEQQNLMNMKIEDILASKGREKKQTKKGHTLQKSSFNVETEKKGTPNGKQSGTKNQKIDLEDPNFWQKVGLPFSGFSAKQLLRQFRNKKNDITASHQSQSKFMKEVSHCVKGILDAKLADNTRTIDDELYELLKKLKKASNLDNKYKEKADIMLQRVLGFDDYQEQLKIQEQVENGVIDFSGIRRQRAAKEKVDYTSKGLRKRDLKMSYKNNPEDKKGSNEQSSEDDYGDEVKNERENSKKDNDTETNGHELLDQIDRDLELENKQKKKKQKEREIKKNNDQEQKFGQVSKKLSQDEKNKKNKKSENLEQDNIIEKKNKKIKKHILNEKDPKEEKNVQNKKRKTE